MSSTPREYALDLCRMAWDNPDILYRHGQRKVGVMWPAFGDHYIITDGDESRQFLFRWEAIDALVNAWEKEEDDEQEPVD